MVRSFGHVEMGIYEWTLKESIDKSPKNMHGNQLKTSTFGTIDQRKPGHKCDRPAVHNMTNARQHYVNLGKNNFLIKTYFGAS